MDHKSTISYVNIHGILKACRKNILFILLAVFLCAFAMYGYFSFTHVLQPEYSVAFTYTVLPKNFNTQNEQLSKADMDASAALGALYNNLYSDPTYTRHILGKIGAIAENNSSDAQITSSITASAHVFKMRISSNNATITKLLTDAVIDDLQTSEGLPPGSKVVFNEDIYQIEVKKNSGDSLKKYIAVGILLGLFFSIAFIALKSILQCTITEPSMLTTLSGMPVLTQANVSVKE